MGAVGRSRLGGHIQDRPKIKASHKEVESSACEKYSHEREPVMRAIKKLIIALGVVLGMWGMASVQPAGAMIVANYNWIAGRPMYNYYGGGSFCSTGPHFINQVYQLHLVVMPKHCFGSAFMSRWENADVFDGAQVAFGPAPASDWDIAAVVTGSISAPKPKSDLIWNYCNAGNCSSSGGGGSSNPNWAGYAMTINGFHNTLAMGQYVCKSGFSSGTSCGTVTNTWTNFIGDPYYGNLYVSGYVVSNLTGCGATYGDSGGPVFTQNGTTAKVAGYVVGGGQLFAAGPGNGCYPQGALYSASMIVMSVQSIRSVFSGSSLIPYW